MYQLGLETLFGVLSPQMPAWWRECRNWKVSLALQQKTICEFSTFKQALKM